MATFKFGRYIDIHWNGYDIVGPADTVFSIPDQLYEEFNSDISAVEPTLQWIDINEFQTLKDNVTSYSVAATAPIAIATSTSTAGLETKTWSLNANYSTSTHDHSGTYQPAGTYVNAVVGSSPATVSTSSGTATVSISSGTAADGYVLTADGAGGVAFEASTGGLSSLVGTSPISATVVGSSATVSINSGTNPNGYLMAADGSGGIIFTPASTSGLTSVVGVSPISSVVSGGTVSVSLTANYQTAGTYVTGVVGTSPISASGTTSITVTIDQALITGATAATNAETLRHYVKNTTGTTIAKGSAVYISGATGDNALISLATASTEVGSSKTLGLTAESIANDAFGYVVEAGYLAGIDTSSTTAGASVWLGNTPGSLVFGAPPAEPSHSVYLGVVIREQQNNGSILVKVQNGYELDELHDVYVGGVSTSLPLVYSSTSSGWVAQALTSVGIADNAIVSSKINASAVTSGHIAAAAVGSAAIASGSINSTHIGANAVVAGDIAANAVTSGNIAAGVVGSAELADNAVIAAKIAAAAVGTAKIDSTTASSWWVLTANGSGGATFTPQVIATNAITSTAYTAALADAGRLIEFNNASAITFTIPANSTAAFATGTQIDLLQTGAGQVTVAAGVGVTLNGNGTKLKLNGQWAGASIIKRATNTWVIIGNTAA